MLILFCMKFDQPLSEVLQWHPRDMDTWIALALAETEQAEQDRRFEKLREEHATNMGRR